MLEKLLRKYGMPADKAVTQAQLTKIAIYVSSYCFICVLILLHMCPHTSTYVSSYYYISAASCYFISSVRIRRHTSICVLILHYILASSSYSSILHRYICARFEGMRRGRSEGIRHKAGHTPYVPLYICVIRRHAPR
jgi:hypothetical protein